MSVTPEKRQAMRSLFLCFMASVYHKADTKEAEMKNVEFQNEKC